MDGIRRSLLILYQGCIHLEEVLTKGPFLFPINESWLNKDKLIIKQLRPATLNMRVLTNEWTIYVSWRMIHEISSNWDIVQSILIYALVILSWDLENVRVFTQLLHLFALFIIVNISRCYSDPVVCPGIQICNDTSMSFAWVNLSELFDSAHFRTYSIF